MDSDGVIVDHVYVPGQPSGLGFTPQGDLLISSMNDRHVLRLKEGRLTRHAYVGAEIVGPCNDMIVDSKGRAYVGGFGFEVWYEHTAPVPPSSLVMVDPHGKVYPAADGLMVPNGMALSPDGTELVVAETLGCRLTSFRVEDNGRLTNRAVFAKLGDRQPDGICLGPDENVWAASANTEEFVCVRRGGEIIAKIPTPGRMAICCARGGRDMEILYCATATYTRDLFEHGLTKGQIEMVVLN